MPSLDPTTFSDSLSIPAVEACYGGYYEPQDWIYVKDTDSDGKRAGIHWRILNDAGTVINSGICQNTYGKGTWALCKHNFDEGKRIRITCGACDGSAHPCGTLDQWNWGSTDTGPT